MWSKALESLLHTPKWACSLDVTGYSVILKGPGRRLFGLRSVTPYK